MGLITTAKQDIERLLKLSDDNAANAILDRLKKKVTIFFIIKPPFCQILTSKITRFIAFFYEKKSLETKIYCSKQYLLRS